MMHKWKGNWIQADMKVEDRRSPLFQKSFFVEKIVDKAEICICGLGFFELRINGRLPDDSVLNPAHTQYSKTVLYRVFDVKHLLKEGENQITVELGNGFYNETTNVWKWDTAVWRSVPQLIADLDISYKGGEMLSVCTDDSWEYTLDGVIKKNSIYYGETHDFRTMGKNWYKAEIVSGPSGILKRQNIPPIRRINTLSPEKIFRKGESTLVIICPEMVTGWCKLNLAIPEGKEVFVTYSETLDSKGLPVKIGKGEGRDGNWWPLGYIQQDSFIGNGNLLECEPKFSYKGFKYILIENYSDELSAKDVEIYRIANDVQQSGRFSSSEEKLNKLHGLMCRTILNNFQGKPTDTPVWEKNGWLGDLSCGLRSMIYNFRMDEFLMEFVNTMKDCFEEFGEVPVMVPTANWGTGNSPVWNTVFVFACRALLDFYGKKDYVEELYPYLKAFAVKDIELLGKQNWLWGARGLADWVSPIGGENAPADPNTSEGAEICGTAYIYKMLRDMEYISTEIGERADTELFSSAATEIYKAFNEAFYNSEKCCYETHFWEQRGARERYRQTSDLVPLAFGMVPEEYREKVAKKLAEDFVRKEYHLDTGCIGTQYILPVLFDNGYADIAYKVLNQNTYPSWGHWLRMGYDSAWESWENTTRSRNHYFLGTYEEAFYSHIIGFRDVKKGYKSFLIKPELMYGPEYVSGGVDTPFGTVECNWKKNEGGFTVEIKLPQGVEAHIILRGETETIDEFCSGGSYLWNIR